MVKCNRIIRVHFPTGSAVSDCEENLYIPFPVMKMKIKGLVYKCNKNISNQDADFLSVFSNIVEGPLGFVYDDITKGIKGSDNIEFEFSSPRSFGGRFNFELRQSDGSIYITTTADDHLNIIIEFEG